MSPMFYEPVYVNQTEKKMPTNGGSFSGILKLDSQFVLLNFKALAYFIKERFYLILIDKILIISNFPHILIRIIFVKV